MGYFGNLAVSTTRYNIAYPCHAIMWIPNNISSLCVLAIIPRPMSGIYIAGSTLYP